MSEINNSGKVSIVLPVYNGELNVGNAISSVLNQTYRNWELIIVNDCSTDGTSEVVKQYAEQDPRIKIMNNAINLKLPATLNVGFRNASGKYYTWTSDDNLYKEDAIEKMVEALESAPDYDMVYANYTIIDAENHEISKACLDNPGDLIIGNVIGACFLYTSQIAKQVGEYDVNLFLAEDYDYWIRIWRAGKILHIDDNLYYYRRHPRSLSETKKQWIGMQTYRALEKNFLFLYSAAKTKKERYALFDQLVFWAGEDRLIEVETLLCDVDKKYAVYKIQKKVKEKLYHSINTLRRRTAMFCL